MRRRLTGIAAALVLSIVPVVIVSTPASAVSVRICNKSGKQLCIGASSLTDGTVITITSPGRDIILQDQGFRHGTLEVYRLVFAVDTSKCVGFSSTGLAEVRDCSGNSNFTNWINNGAGGSTFWQNNSFDPANCATGGDHGTNLTSDNGPGDRLFCSIGGRAGDYLAWTPHPSP